MRREVTKQGFMLTAGEIFYPLPVLQTIVKQDTLNLNMKSHFPILRPRKKTFETPHHLSLPIPNLGKEIGHIDLLILHLHNPWML